MYGRCMAAHTCKTSDGAEITCLCSTGRDHDDTEMDLRNDTLTDTVAERPDIITGLAE